MNLTPLPPAQPEIVDLDNVVAINPDSEKELEITRKRISERFMKCSGIHGQILVDSKTRTIQCSKCGFVIDPFEYIDQWAREGESRMDGLEGIKVRTRIARMEYEDLQRKIKNARSVLKRSGQPQSMEERGFWQNEAYRAEHAALNGI